MNEIPAAHEVALKSKMNGSHVINEYLKCDPKARQIEMELAMEEDEND